MEWLTPALGVSLLALVMGIANTWYGRRRDSTKDTAADERRLTTIEDSVSDLEDASKRLDADIRKAEERIDRLAARISEAESSLKVMNKQVDLFWGTVTQQMAKQFSDKDRG